MITFSPNPLSPPRSRPSAWSSLAISAWTHGVRAHPMPAARLATRQTPSARRPTCTSSHAASTSCAPPHSAILPSFAHGTFRTRRCLCPSTSEATPSAQPRCSPRKDHSQNSSGFPADIRRSAPWTTAPTSTIRCPRSSPPAVSSAAASGTPSGNSSSQVTASSMMNALASMPSSTQLAISNSSSAPTLTAATDHSHRFPHAELGRHPATRPIACSSLASADHGTSPSRSPRSPSQSHGWPHHCEIRKPRLPLMTRCLTPRVATPRLHRHLKLNPSPSNQLKRTSHQTRSSPSPYGGTLHPLTGFSTLNAACGPTHAASLAGSSSSPSIQARNCTNGS